MMLLVVKRRRMIVVLMLALILLVAGSARADRRGYVWTYEYLTMPKGEAELEYYLTTKVPDAENYNGKNTWDHQLEFEYGLTDHWDLSIYQRAKQANIGGENNFAYTGVV